MDVLLITTFFFLGRVLEIRDVVLLGNTFATAALVQSLDGKQIWVLQHIEAGPLTIDPVVLGSAQPGDIIRVEIAGAHVLPNRVDWSLCQPADSAYCQFGLAYESAPISSDWGVPLSPSNIYIRKGHTGPHPSNALYWHSIVLAHAGFMANWQVAGGVPQPVFLLIGTALPCPGPLPQKPGSLAGAVDTTAPIVSWHIPQPGIIAVTAEDFQSMPARLEVSFDGENWMEQEYPIPWASPSIRTPAVTWHIPIPEDARNISVRAIDAAGNLRTASGLLR